MVPALGGKETETQQFFLKTEDLRHQNLPTASLHPKNLNLEAPRHERIL